MALGGAGAAASAPGGSASAAPGRYMPGCRRARVCSATACTSGRCDTRDVDMAEASVLRDLTVGGWRLGERGKGEVRVTEEA